VAIEDDALLALFHDPDLPWGFGVLTRSRDRIVHVPELLDFGAKRVAAGRAELERAADSFVVRSGGRRLEGRHALNPIRRLLGRRPKVTMTDAYLLPGAFFADVRYTRRDAIQAYGRRNPGLFRDR
jgi:hypothetical protein